MIDHHPSRKQQEGNYSPVFPGRQRIVVYHTIGAVSGKGMIFPNRIYSKPD
jgi:hypothetical protein